MGILMPVVFGLAIAYLLAPVLNFLEQKALFPLCRKCGIKESPRQRSLVRGVGILVTCFLGKALLAGQHIDGDNKTYGKILHHIQHIDDATPCLSA